LTICKDFFRQEKGENFCSFENTFDVFMNQQKNMKEKRITD